MADSINHNEDNVLRAKDILPPYKNDNHPEQGKPAQPVSETKTQENQIPKYNLAEQIMSEQRRQAATRRVKPERKAEAANKDQSNLPIYCQCIGLEYISAEQEQVISEIVARDIQYLRQNYSNLS